MCSIIKDIFMYLSIYKDNISITSFCVPKYYLLIPSQQLFSIVFIMAPKPKSTDLTNRPSTKRKKQSPNSSVPQSSSLSTISPEVLETITKEVTEKVTVTLRRKFPKCSTLSSQLPLLVRGVLHMHLVLTLISIGITQFRKLSRQ